MAVALHFREVEELNLEGRMKKIVRALIPAIVSITLTFLLCLGYALMVDTSHHESELEPAGVLSQTDTNSASQS